MAYPSTLSENFNPFQLQRKQSFNNYGNQPGGEIEVQNYNRGVADAGGFGSGGGPQYAYNPNQKFSLGMNMGTLQLGGAILGAYNGWQANKEAKRGNVIAQEQLEQNAKSFDINTGLQLSTMQAEESRRNAYAGGFLDDSQRSDRFRDYDLQKLSVS
jgi:hypothetical protein